VKKPIIVLLMLIYLVASLAPGEANAGSLRRNQDRTIICWSGGVWYSWHLEQWIGFDYTNWSKGIELYYNYNGGIYQSNQFVTPFVIAGDLNIYQGTNRIRNWRGWELSSYTKIIPAGYTCYGGRVYAKTVLDLIGFIYYATANAAWFFEGQSGGWTLRYDF